MAQYIDKDALVAEIERLQDAIKSTAIDDRISKEQAEAYKVCVKLRFFVEDTLEVKEVDLEKELQSFFYPHVPWGDYCKNEQEDIEEWSFKIAKHFFGLGMIVSNKAQKGE